MFRQISRGLDSSQEGKNNFIELSFNLRKSSVNIKLWNSELGNRILKYYSKDYDLASKIGLEELKNYLRVRMKPIKTSVEVETD